jgi:threonine/homoserine/homoserine lactone efflux protein
MITELAVKCVLIGLILALPTGPVGILCLRRTLVAGWRAGLVSGIGACVADLFYVVVVRIGLTSFERFVRRENFRLHVVAGFIVIAAGSWIIANPPYRFRTEPDRNKRLFTSTFLLSVTNPTLLVSIPALFAVMRLPPVPHDAVTATVTVFSVFAGSLVWWAAITQWLDRSSNTLTEHAVRRASTLAGAAMILLGVISLSSLMA